MEKKEFTITIDAPKETVWQVLWNDGSYRKWTAVFSEGSRAETDWKTGSKVLFLDAKNAGMVSVVAENRPNEYMSFKHLGFVKDGVEDLESEAVKKWAGATENYTLRSSNGSTELIVDMQITKEYMDYFSEIWPKALQLVKELAEKN
ncbi:MAG: SRPBCC domain-containing protein [Chitinophagaceae bacterium]